FTPIDLVRLETFNSELMALLWIFVELGVNMLIIGGTASGKTTTLNACCLFIPENRRIISIEDTRELKLLHDNWVPLVTREEKKLDGLRGGLDAMYLLKRALRMRTEYLIVGEVRGEEARILFQAMNTGHIVFSTMHAGSVEEAFTRLFNPPISVPPTMVLPLDLVVVQSIVQVEGREVRRCVYVGEVEEVDVENKKVSLRQLYSWDPKKDKIVKVDKPIRIFEKIKRFRRWSEKEVLEEIKKRKSLLEYAISRGIKGYMGFIELLKSFKEGRVKGGVSSRL
ncbi:secretion system protein, partial [Candidatus Bathyarchaeota archaeon]